MDGWGGKSWDHSTALEGCQLGMDVMILPVL